MGRPTKSLNRRRSAQVGLRFTLAEMTKLQRDADKAGLTVTDLCRQRALSGRTYVKRYRSLDWPALDQLRRIGVNLNQAVRVANATKNLPPELARATTAVEDFLMKQIKPHGP